MKARLGLGAVRAVPQRSLPSLLGPERLGHIRPRRSEACHALSSRPHMHIYRKPGPTSIQASEAFGKPWAKFICASDLPKLGRAKPCLKTTLNF